MGFGFTHEFGELSDVLKKIDMKIKDPDKCNKSHYICTVRGKYRKSLCRGDEGAPLIVKVVY